ncbi:hypothetical protein ES705_47104 [subsurface metagenome]
MHKNLEILYSAAEMADRRHLPIQFVLTISKKQGRAAKRLVQAIKKENFNLHIINVGKIPQSKISSFVNSVDALILPSLCESYGLSSLEAWFHEKPYLVSDIDFAHEVCRKAALYFDPADANSIISAIELLLVSDKQVDSCILAGKERLRDLSNAPETVRKILSI